MNLNLVPSLNISATGLEAERTRMSVAANNLANVHSTRGQDGVLYQRRQVVFAAVMDDAVSRERPADALGGVKIDDVVADPRPPAETYAPYHPHADSRGMVQTPNISPIEEMLDMITAGRAYDSNLSAMKQSREMAMRTIDLLKPS